MSKSYSFGEVAVAFSYIMDSAKRIVTNFGSIIRYSQASQEVRSALKFENLCALATHCVAGVGCRGDKECTVPGRAEDQSEANEAKISRKAEQGSLHRNLERDI